MLIAHLAHFVLHTDEREQLVPKRVVAIQQPDAILFDGIVHYEL